MSKPASMHYQNPLFYILTQVLGVTVLLGWLAYTVQQSPLDMSLTRFFYDAAAHGFPWRHQTVVDAMGQFVVWLVPIGCALFCGAAAVLSYRAKSIAPARSVLWALFAVFCLVPVLAGGLKHYTALPRPFSATWRCRPGSGLRQGSRAVALCPACMPLSGIQCLPCISRDGHWATAACVGLDWRVVCSWEASSAHCVSCRGRTS
jgi:membrane-associated PAP2 superfamily phosphatase